MIKVIVHIAKAIVAALMSLLLFSCGFEKNFKNVDGSGNVITQERPTSKDFKAISVSGGIEVIIEQGNDKSVKVEADDNLQQHIKTEITGDGLSITTDVNIRNAASKKVYVRLPEIESIECSGGAQVTSRQSLKAGTINLSSGSGSSMEVAIDAEHAKCESSSGSSLKINGRAGRLDTESSSGSTLNANKLMANKVTAESSSGSTTIVNPTESLKADASSGSAIYYIKTPGELNKKTSSGGSVAQQ